MRHAVAVEPLAGCADWTARSLAEYVGATAFHEPWCLRSHGVERVLTVRAGGQLLAGLPLFETADGRRVAQCSRSVPYSGPIFARRPSHPRRVAVWRRGLMRALIEALQDRYDAVTFAASPALHDVVPFIQAGFAPELRYTYVVTDGAEAGYAGGRRNDLVRARRAGLVVESDPALTRFDVEAATAWLPGSAGPTRALLESAIQRGRGTAWVASRGGDVVGGLFMVQDAHRGYTTHAYHTADGARVGAATTLYHRAFRFARQQGLSAVDLEGSVLPGVERYYQSFNATQTIYLRLHWYADPAESPSARAVYDYR